VNSRELIETTFVPAGVEPIFSADINPQIFSAAIHAPFVRATMSTLGGPERAT
jgi:hypothetical protein